MGATCVRSRLPSMPIALHNFWYDVWGGGGPAGAAARHMKRRVCVRREGAVASMTSAASMTSGRAAGQRRGPRRRRRRQGGPECATWAFGSSAAMCFFGARDCCVAPPGRAGRASGRSKLPLLEGTLASRSARLLQTTSRVRAGIRGRVWRRGRVRAWSGRKKVCWWVCILSLF